MIYPQSWTSKISNFFGLYGAGNIANAAADSITNTLDVTWTADILVGDGEQAIPVIFDTATHYLILEGCSGSGTCTDRFNYEDSGSFTAGAVSTSLSIETNTMEETTYIIS